MQPLGGGAITPVPPPPAYAPVLSDRTPNPVFIATVKYLLGTKLLFDFCYTTSRSDVSTSICSGSSSAHAAATRSSSRFICHAQLAVLAQLPTRGHVQVVPVDV